MTSQIVKLTSRNEIDQSLLVMDYVLGQLSEKEKADFETRLLTDKSLQQALSEELQLKRLITSTKTEYEVSEQAFNDFIAKTDSTNRTAIKNKTVKRSAWMAYAALFSLFFIGYSYYPEQNRAEFEALSNNQMQLIENAQKLEYTLIFDREINPSQFKDIAESLNLSILSGPGAGGSYLVKAKKPLNEEQLLAIRQNTSIIFIEPAVSVKQ